MLARISPCSAMSFLKTDERSEWPALRTAISSTPRARARTRLGPPTRPTSTSIERSATLSYMAGSAAPEAYNLARRSWMNRSPIQTGPARSPSARHHRGFLERTRSQDQVELLAAFVHGTASVRSAIGSAWDSPIARRLSIYNVNLARPDGMAAKRHSLRMPSCQHPT